MNRILPVLRTALAAGIALSIVAPLTQARVTRLQITSRELVAGGMSFGDAGAYEKLQGTAYFEVDPGVPGNAQVFDLDKAPRNSRGNVEFSADMFILQPVDSTRGNGGLFLEVNNRGNKNSLFVLNDVPFATRNNPSSATELGNGFLLRQGYTLAWIGWSPIITPGGGRLTVQYPFAMENGSPINERILTEFSDGYFGGGTPFTLPLSGSVINKSYESVSTDQTVAKAELGVRSSDSPRPSAAAIPKAEIIARSQWSFAKCPDGPPGIPSTTDICLAGGFRNDKVYELTYQATKSPVSGLGYVATRDFLAFLRNATVDETGNPNPVSGVTRVLCYGISISAQYLRDFIYQGFNEDEQGRRVCDGASIHVAGAQKLPLNYRFSRDPSGTALWGQHVGRHSPDVTFPSTYAVSQDPLTGDMDGILKRPNTDPKIFHSDSSSEYWQKRASLVDTNTDGTVDLIQPDNVRRYVFSGLEHFHPAPVATYGTGNRQWQQLDNPIQPSALARALLIALDKWVRDGTEPPYSRAPRLDDGTLIETDRYCDEFPRIPGVTCNGVVNATGVRDFGARVRGNRGAIDKLIPDILSEYRLLVPKVDQLGIDIGGLRHPLVEAPTATLTGWNLRRSEFTDGDLADVSGMMVPLHRTRADRLKAGDPRPSLEELYGTHEGYVESVQRAARNLARLGYLLPEDADLIIQQAEQSDVLK